MTPWVKQAGTVALSWMLATGTWAPARKAALTWSYRTNIYDTLWEFIPNNNKKKGSLSLDIEVSLKKKALLQILAQASVIVYSGECDSWGGSIIKAEPWNKVIFDMPPLVHFRLLWLWHQCVSEETYLPFLKVLFHLAELGWGRKKAACRPFISVRCSQAACCGRRPV